MSGISMLRNPIQYEDLNVFVLDLINLAIQFSILIAIVALIVAGLKYILAMGDEEKVENATRSLVFALVGLVIVFIAPLLVKYITSLIGVEQ